MQGSNYKHSSKFKTMQRRLFFARADINTSDQSSRHITVWQSKKGLFSRFFVFCFVLFFDGTMPRASCLSVYTHSRTLRSSSDGKKEKKTHPLFVQDGHLKALVIGRFLFWLPLSGTTFLLSSDTAVLSHSSEFLLNLSLYFCLL